MSAALDQALDDYLGLHRSLGRKYVDHGIQLPQFVAYLDSGWRQDGHHRAGGGVGYPTDRQHPGVVGPPADDGARLRPLLESARPRHRDPLSELLPFRASRVDPYLYSDDDIAALMAAARTLRPPLRAATYETLIGLIAATGMRSGEAVRLRPRRHRLGRGGDHDLALEVRQKPSRACPSHQPGRAAPIRRGPRRVHVPDPRSPDLLLPPSAPGSATKTTRPSAAWSAKPAWTGPSGRGPRPHDLRHRFAVDTLIGWYRAGVDVEAHMPLLSTYMGHLRTRRARTGICRPSPSCCSWPPNASSEQEKARP